MKNGKPTPQIEKIYPLAPMQASLLYASLLEPQSTAYINQLQFELQGKVNIEAITQTFRYLVAKYDILRTIFVHEKVKTPQQVVLQSRSLTVEFQDLTQETAKESMIEHYLRQSRQKPFDLSRDVLLRVALFQTNSNQYTLCWTYHHILLDGWGRQYLMHDFFEIYAHCCLNAAYQITQKIPYKPFIDWLQEQNIQEAKDFWKQELSSITQASHLPIPYQKNNSTASYHLRHCGGKIGASTYQQITAIVRSAETTFSTFFQAIWAVFLKRYTQVNEVVFGVVITTQPPDNEVLGLFINTIPLRVHVDSSQNFGALVRQIHQSNLANQPYRYLSLAEIQAEHPLANQLFNHIVLFENYPLESEPNPNFAQKVGFEVIIGQSTEHSHYDLNLVLQPEKEGFSFRFDYNGNVYEEKLIQLWVEYLQNLISQVIDNQDVLIRDLSLFDKEDWESIERIALGRNLSPHPKPSLNQSRLPLIPPKGEKTKERGTNEKALIFGDKTLTYSQLYQQVAQFKRFLQKTYQIKESDNVGVSLPRSTELIIAMLAVFELGAIYVPIDVNYPQVRRDYIQADSELKLLITNEELRKGNWELGIGNEELGITSHSALPTPHSAPLTTYDLRLTTYTTQIAYRMYTSGSTGKPKGVNVTYRNLQIFIESCQTILAWRQDDVILFTASPAFDISLFQVLVPLSLGCTIRIADQAKMLNWDYLQAEIQQVTVLDTVPAFLQQMLQSAENPFPNINKLFTGGDAVPSDLLLKAETIFPNAQKSIFYGPTETTIFVSHFQAPCNRLLPANMIGKPLPHAQLWLLDADGQYLPPYAEGELWIGGEGVSAGYHKSPLSPEGGTPLGNAAFVQQEALEIIYKSGDLARYNLSGDFEFLGRIDNQVKIRGQRLEPAEIESIIQKIPEVAANLVLPFRTESDEWELSAFIICKEKKTAEKSFTDSIRQCLAAQLPAYMIPTYFHFLEEFPLNENGKTDRKSLTSLTLNVSPKERGNYGGELFGETELYLAGLWSEVIGKKIDSREADFFQVGGHSLKAISIIARLKKEKSVQITIKDLFQYPKLNDLARFIESLTPNPSPKEREEHIYADSYKITANLESSPFEGIREGISAAQKRLLFLQSLEPDNHAYWLAFALSIRGKLDMVRLEKALKTVQARHEILGKTFDELGEKVFKISIEYIDNQENILHLRIHHLITDGISLQLLVKELWDLYQGKELPEITLQYKDYIAWEAQRPKTDLAYWHTQFLENTPILELPTDFPRPLYQDYAGGEFWQDLPLELSEQIKEYCQNKQVTPQMFFLAGFYIWLAHYTTQIDLVVGVPVSGRYHPDWEYMQGLFVNMLPMRQTIDWEVNFEEWLAKIKEYSLQSYEHQQFSFAELVELVNPLRQTNRNPLFDVSLGFQEFEEAEFQIENLQISSIPIERDTSLFDFSIEIVPKSAFFSFRVEYAKALLCPDTARRMFEHYQVILTKIIQNPQEKLFKLNPLNLAEERLLQHWGTPDFTFEAVEKLHFPQENPSQTALIVGSRQWTYAQLFTEANRLAQYLISEKGVQAGENVGLSSPRNEFQIIALLAIWQCGATVVNLSPNLPPERERHIRESANIKVILSPKSPLTPKRGTNSPSFEEGWGGATPPGSGGLYLIFTSGSTGEPKGIQVSANNLLSITKAWQEVYALKSSPFGGISGSFGAKILQLADFSFDVFFGDVARSILSGGTLVIADEIQRLVPEEIIELIENQQITHVETTPFIARLLTNTLRSQDRKMPACLQCLIVGSDIWYVHEYQALRACLAPHTRLISSYGLTEFTIDSTYFEGDVADLSPTALVPIGIPYPNTQVQVLDKFGQMLPIGVWGALWIGGWGISRSFGEGRGAAYAPFGGWGASGDIARWHPKGFLEFKGRNDNQLKIRGYRIEIGAIENAILQYPAIEQVAVIAQNEELSAFYISRESTDSQAVWRFIQAKLPAYMIPAYWMQIPQMPLTASGKIDRLALAKIPITPIQITDNQTFTYLQKQIAAIWQTLLSVSEIQANSDFFAIGGNSLKAVQLVNRFRNTWGVAVSLRDIFRLPTLNGMADLLENSPQSKSSQIIPTQRNHQISLSPAQRRMWFVTQLAGDSAVYNLPHVYQIKGGLDLQKLEIAIQKLIHRHEILRTNFQIIQGIPQQIIQSSIHTSFIFHKAIEWEKETIKEIINNECNYIFDIANEPLIRFIVLQITESDFIFLSTVHHIIFDGWSDAVLIQDLFRFYQDEKTTLLRYQYQDYTRWILNQDNTKAKHYWLNIFKNLPPTLQLPYKDKRPEVATHTGNVLKVIWDREFTTQFNLFNQAYQLTAFQSILAMYALALGEWSGQADIVIGTVNAGRDREEWEGLIGLFLNSIALRIDLQNINHSADYLQSVRQNVIDAFEHQAYPIEELISELNLPYDTSRNPLFDVALIMQNYAVKKLAMDNMQIEPYPVETVFSRLDLTIYAQEIEAEMRLNFEYNTDLFSEAQINTFSRLLLQTAQNMIQSHTLPQLASKNNFTETIVVSPNSIEIIPPQHETEIKIYKIYQDILRINDFGIHQSFFKLGGHSLKALQLLEKINQTFSVNLNLRAIYENPSIYQLAVIISKQAEQYAESNKMYEESNLGKLSQRVIHLHQNNKRDKILFFIPPILGSATIFKSLADALDYEAYGFNYRGLEDGELYENSIAAMANSINEEIIRLNLKNKNIQIIAYSFGCLVAFDLAKLLEERFDSVKLILLDKSVNDDTEVSSVETNELDDYIENLLTQLHEIDTTIAHTAYIKRVKKLYEHNLNLAEKYIHQGKLKVNIIALEAKDNTPKTEMKKWGHFTSGEFSHQYIQGEHYTLLNPEYLIELASIIQDFLK